MGELKVSVVLATYNGSKYIQQQLDSYLNQSQRPNELVVGDDGSKDDTLEIVERFAKTCGFPVVILRNLKTLGYADNFLNAAAHASGDLVAFSDQDDVWLPSKVERSAKAFLDADVLLSAHVAELIDGDGKPFGMFNQGIKATRKIETNLLPAWGFFNGFSMTVRRSMLGIIPSNLRFGSGLSNGLGTAHDRWMYFLADAFGSTVTLKEPLVQYRQHSNNVFGSAEASLPGMLQERIPSLIRYCTEFMNMATNRAELLEAAAATNESREIASAAGRSAKRWRAIATYHEKRLEIYSQRKRIKRFNSLVRNVVGGVYHGAARTGTLRPVAKDLISVFK